MKVIALKDGFYGGSRQRAGQTFDVGPSAKGLWFTPVKEDKPAASKTPAKGQSAANKTPAGNGSDDLV